jgi:hypothetical protein
VALLLVVKTPGRFARLLWVYFRNLPPRPIIVRSTYFEPL